MAVRQIVLPPLQRVRLKYMIDSLRVKGVSQVTRPSMLYDRQSEIWIGTWSDRDRV